MSPREYWSVLATANAIEAFCQRAGTPPSNFKQLALYGGHVSGRLAIRMAKASDGNMTVEDVLDPADPEMRAARKKRARQIAQRASKAAA